MPSNQGIDSKKSSRMLSVREHLMVTTSNQSPRHSSRIASATKCLDPKVKKEQQKQIEEEMSKGPACDSCKMAFDGKAPHPHNNRLLCDVCFDQLTAKICDACKSPINCFSQHHKFFSSKDGVKNWHDFCIQCYQCKALLVSESKRFKLDDATYCAACYDRRPGNECANCKMPIYKKSQDQKLVNSKDGKKYHQFCLICKGCGKSLIHVPCYCHDAGGTYCAECYDTKVGDKCAKCDKLIKSVSQHHQKCVLSDGTTFHDFCLTCSYCGKFMVDNRIFTLDGDFLCAICYDAKTAYLCDRCKKPINVNSEGHEKYSSQDGQNHWHSHCLLCWSCNRPLAGKTIHWRDERMFCNVCRTNSANFRKISVTELVLFPNAAQ